MNAAAQTVEIAMENNLFGDSYGSHKENQDTEKWFKPTCGSMSVNPFFSKHGSKIFMDRSMQQRSGV